MMERYSIQSKTNPSEIITQIFQKEIRLEILAILNMYDKLNVTQISNLSGYSKTTVARQLIELEKINILRAQIIPATIVGRKDQKIYSLNHEGIPNLEITQNVEDLQNKDELKSLLSFSELSIKSFIKSLEIYNYFFENFLEIYDFKENDRNLLNNYSKLINPDLRFLFFNEENYIELLKIRKQYMEKVNHILDLQDKDISSKSHEYFYFDGLLNLKQLYEFRAFHKKEGIKKKK